MKEGMEVCDGPGEVALFYFAVVFLGMRLLLLLLRRVVQRSRSS